ncbi:MAG: ABC transporter permease [Dehalococcoidia bacterium]|nr:ABC transporter permease [Dehalococcoidia bacterium]
MTILPHSVQNTIIWGGFRVWQRNRDAFFRSWGVEVGGIFVEPFILLVALGFGLGSYIQGFDDLSYAEFLAPGIIPSYAMFHATFDSTIGAYLRKETHHIYEAVLFTPLGPADIVIGEVMWSATRAVLSAVAVLVVAAMFGLVDSPMAVLAIPSAYLIGVSIASIAMIMTATANTIGSMNNFFTLFILPMFWVSGVFFPLERLPEWVQYVAWILPLTPATALVRGLVTGDLSWTMFAWALELIAYTVVALLQGSYLKRRRLMK